MDEILIIYVKTKLLGECGPIYPLRHAKLWMIQRHQGLKI